MIITIPETVHLPGSCNRTDACDIDGMLHDLNSMGV